MSPFKLEDMLNAVKERRHCSGAACRLEPGWLVMEAAVAGPVPDPLEPHDGGPGPWKVVLCADGPRRVFEVPAAAFPGVEDPDEAAVLVDACLDWAFASAAGETPAEWVCPGPDEALRAMPARRLGLVAGSFASRIEVLANADTGRLALRCIVLPAPDSRMGETRKILLRAILLETQDRWRMVRAEAVAGPEGPAPALTVDLTGAPPELLPGLLACGLDVLRAAVLRLADPVTLLSDPHAASMALDRAPARSERVYESGFRHVSYAP
jgi:hypothetical protein